MSNETRSSVQHSGTIDIAANDRLVGMTSLLQDNVYDASGNKLGQLEELILDARTGCVRYAVLALGGFLGIGQKRVAIPWSGLTAEVNYHRCIVDAALMRLTAVAVPENDPWLRRIDRTWDKHSAYMPRHRGNLGRNPARASFHVHEAETEVAD